MKFAIIMNQNSYPGREYLNKLKDKKLNIDVIEIGNFAEIDYDEEKRCEGLWKAASMESLKDFYDFYSFETLKSSSLYSFLKLKKYDIGIQGGTGIIGSKIFSKFKFGILNFHPGDLPQYRGCSAPEWQLWEKKPIIATCHLIDEGIDSGPIFDKCQLNVNMSSYHAFRASIYPELSDFVLQVIMRILKTKNLKFKNQDESYSKYRNYIGDLKIKKLKEIFIK